VLDAEVPFDPLQEELNLPTVLVEFYHVKYRDLQVVDEEDPKLCRFLVEVAHLALKI